MSSLEGGGERVSGGVVLFRGVCNVFSLVVEVFFMSGVLRGTGRRFDISDYRESHISRA